MGSPVDSPLYTCCKQGLLERTAGGDCGRGGTSGTSAADQHCVSPSHRPGRPDPDLRRFPAAVRRSSTRARPLLNRGDTPLQGGLRNRCRKNTHNERWWRRHGHPCGKACEPAGTHLAPGPARRAMRAPRVIALPFSARKRARACSGLNPSGIDGIRAHEGACTSGDYACVGRSPPAPCAAPRVLSAFPSVPRGLYVHCSLLAAAMADGHRPRVWKVLLLQRADQPDAVGVS